MRFGIKHLLAATFLTATFSAVVKSGWLFALPLPAICAGAIFAWIEAGKNPSSSDSSVLVGVKSSAVSAFAMLSLWSLISWLNSPSRTTFSFDENAIFFGVDAVTISVLAATGGAFAGVIVHGVRRGISALQYKRGRGKRNSAPPEGTQKPAVPPSPDYSRRP